MQFFPVADPSLISHVLDKRGVEDHQSHILSAHSA